MIKVKAFFFGISTHISYHQMISLSRVDKITVFFPTPNHISGVRIRGGGIVAFDREGNKKIFFYENVVKTISQYIIVDGS